MRSGLRDTQLESSIFARIDTNEGRTSSLISVQAGLAAPQSAIATAQATSGTSLADSSSCRLVCGLSHCCLWHALPRARAQSLARVQAGLPLRASGKFKTGTPD